jgi:hypothetical protein
MTRKFSNESDSQVRLDASYLSSNSISSPNMHSSSLVSQPRLVIKSFDQLRGLQARSRQPIDIPQQLDSAKLSLAATMPTQSILRTNSVNTDIISKSSSTFASQDRSRTSNNTAILSSLNQLVRSESSVSHIMSDVTTPKLNAQPACNETRKYFSFLTTNKSFKNSFQKLNEPKLKIYKNQLIDENDSTSTQHSKSTPIMPRIVAEQFNSTVKSSTRSPNGTDSGCGSSLARSSILSSTDGHLSISSDKSSSANNSDISSDSIDKEEQPMPVLISLSSSTSSTCSSVHSPSGDNSNASKSYSFKHICDKIYNSREENNVSMSSPKNILPSYNNLRRVSSVQASTIGYEKTTSIINPETDILTIEDNNSCSEDLSSRMEQLDIKKKRRKPKTLTVLFDYESYATNPLNRSERKLTFAVKKGESVKVIRDYDEQYFLVSTFENGQIGFVPKDYVVDLEEVKENYKMQTSGYRRESSSSSGSDYCSASTKLTPL